MKLNSIYLVFLALSLSTACNKADDEESSDDETAESGVHCLCESRNDQHQTPYTPTFT